MNIFIFSSILVLLLNACDVLALKKPFAHNFTLSMCSPWNQKDPDQLWKSASVDRVSVGK